MTDWKNLQLPHRNRESNRPFSDRPSEGDAQRGNLPWSRLQRTGSSNSARSQGLCLPLEQAWSDARDARWTS